MNFENSKMDIAGFPVISTSQNALCSLLLARLHSADKSVLLFANSNFIVQTRQYLEWLCSGSVLIVNDGIAMDIGAGIIYGKKFKENLNGTDFCPDFLSELSPARKVFLVGGRPGIAEKAAEVIRQRCGQDVVGCADGFEQIQSKDICNQINSSGAEIILVALGNPRQEAWIKQHQNELNAKLIIGVGALFDFLSGNIKRAPMWVRRIRCEWLYRLWLEPRRLIKRYSIDILHFLYLVIKYGRRDTRLSK